MLRTFLCTDMDVFALIPIHIALDAEGGAYMFFAVHELTHKIKSENADAYRLLSDFVLDKLEESELYQSLSQGEGSTLEERIASVQALYEKRGQTLTRDEAIEEIVCDAIPVILSDEQTVLEFVRADRTLAERVYDFFEKFYNELTQQIANLVYGSANKAEYAALSNDAETVREIADLFKAALETGRSAEMNESDIDRQYDELEEAGSAIEEGDSGRNKRFSAKDQRSVTIKQQIDAHRDELNAMRPVATIESGSRPRKNGKPDKTLEREALHAFYGSRNYSVDRQGFGRIEFDKKALSELVAYIDSDAEFAAAKAAPMVVKRGVLVDSHTEHKGHSDVESFTFAAPVVLNGKRGNEAVVVQYTNRNKPHTVRILLPDGTGFDLDAVEKTDRYSRAATLESGRQQPIESVSNDIIRNPQEESNPSEANAEEKFYDDLVNGGNRQTFSMKAENEGRGIKSVSTQELSKSGIFEEGYLYGVRALTPDQNYKIGDVVRDSFDWDTENDRSTYESEDQIRLDGASTIGITDGAGSLLDMLYDGPREAEAGLNDAMARIKAYVGDRYVLVRSKGGYGGEDNGELILSSPEVVAIYDNTTGEWDIDEESYRKSAEATQGWIREGRNADSNYSMKSDSGSLMDDMVNGSEADAAKYAPRIARKEASRVTEEDVRGLLEMAIQGQLPNSSYIPVRINTPPIVIEKAKTERNDTLENHPVIMQANKVRQATEEIDTGDTGDKMHGLDENDVIAIIRAMGKPDYIVYQKNNNRYSEIVSYRNRGHKLALAVVEFDNYKGSEYLNGFEAGMYNVLVTAFTPDSLYIKKYLISSNNQVLYDKKKDSSQGASGSIAPSVLNDEPFFITSIEREENEVKRENRQKLSAKTGDSDFYDTLAGNDQSDRRAEYDAQQREILAEDSEWNAALAEESSARPAVSERELDRVRAENERLSGRIDALKEQFTITKGYRPNEKALKRVARNLLRKTSSRYSVDSLTDDLRGLFDRIGDQRAFNGDTAMAEANSIARKVLDKSSERDDTMYEATAEARDYFRRAGIALTEKQVDEVKRAYDSYGSYRRSLMGRMNLKKDGIPLDQAWGEICEKFPGYFEKDTKEGDQPQKVKDFLDAAYERPYINPYGTRYNMDDAASELAYELHAAFSNIRQRKTAESQPDNESQTDKERETKAKTPGEKAGFSFERPTTRQGRLQKAWELYDNNMNPQKYYEQSAEKTRQLREMKLFNDGKTSEEMFDLKTNNLLRGLMLRNGENVGGALADNSMQRVTEIFSRAKKRLAIPSAASALELFRRRLLFLHEQQPDCHDHGEDQQIPSCAHAMRDRRCIDHECRADHGGDGHDKALENRHFLFPLHEHHKDGQIHCVDRNDRKLRGIKRDRTEPRVLHQISAKEIGQPDGAQHHAHNG